MNEYERLINYLNTVINSIETKKSNIEKSNANKREIKSFIEKTIEQINNHKLNEIEISNLDLLNEYISESEISELKNKLTELINMQTFLFDERIFNPIKQIMLNDLEKIKNKLAIVNQNILPQTLSEDDIKLQNECKKYLELVNEKGFSKTLSNEDRIKFYEFLKLINYEDTLLLIYNYIIYANKQQKQLEINTSNTAIDIINKNAEEVYKELENNLKNAEKEAPKKEPKTIKKEPKTKKRSGELNKVYEKILELLNIHQIDINTSTYEIYKNYFLSLDFIEIYERRSEFLSSNNVDWEKAIPCIKEKLLPNIDSKDQTLIFKLLNEIIAVNQLELEEYEKERQAKEKYQESLNKFKDDFIEVVKTANKLQPSLSNIINKVQSQTKNNENEINSLVNTVNSLNKDNPGLTEYLKHYNLSYYEVKLYLPYKVIQTNINDIQEYIGLEILNEDDFKEIYDLLEKTKTILKECEEICKSLTLEPTEEETPTEDYPANKKQYEFGESVILFFRKDENSKFLVEEDIEKQQLDRKSYNDINRILRRASMTTHEQWNMALSDPDGFKAIIDYNKPNGDRGDPVTLESDYSHEVYEFFRLKDKKKTVPRLTAFDINMCEENRRKLGIPKDKHIILIIGEKQITTYSNESQDYSDTRKELKNNKELIKKYIELFENPNTSEEVLYKILNDSSDLYKYFEDKVKGLV